MDSRSHSPALLKGLAALKLTLTDQQCKQLLDYLGLFDKWNRTYNLSAIRTPEQMVTHHLLDSLSVAPYIEGQRVIDVGTGAGLPGLVLAITQPQRHFTLLDSAGKKTRFLSYTVRQLGLKNVQVENCRVETFRPESLYDGVISRAFASLQDMTRQCAHLLSAQGVFWAMKGHFPEAEWLNLQEHYQLLANHQLTVPGLVDAQRCLLVLAPRI